MCVPQSSCRRSTFAAAMPRARHAAPLHRIHPWLERLLQRARSGDAGGLRRDIAATASAPSLQVSGSPVAPRLCRWAIIYYTWPSEGPTSWGRFCYLTAGSPGRSSVSIAEQGGAAPRGVWLSIFIDIHLESKSRLQRGYALGYVVTTLPQPLGFISEAKK